MTPRVDVSNTLIDEADAIGADLEFDSNGNHIGGEPEDEEADEDEDDA